MSKIPKVSVIVPAFNEPENTLEQSLTSIMHQTFHDFECIVVDESTKPESAQACERVCGRDARFRYVHPVQRLGLPGSLNLAISMAHGEFLARFDSDDVCALERLELQVAFLEAHSEIGVVGTWLQIIDRSGNPLSIRRYATNHEAIARNFIYSNALGHPTVMLRKSVLEGNEGPYRADFKYSEDLELWLRLLSGGTRFANIPKCLVFYRQDSTHRSAENWKFNIKARLLHVSHPDRVLKVVVIALLAVWAVLPKWLRKVFYRKAILN